MEVSATAKNIRISPKKIRLVVDQIKKMDPAEALSILDFTQKSSSGPLKKIISSAIANARNNFGLEEGSLKFKAIEVGKGPVFKRYRPVSRGRAHAILKRTSHIKVVITGEEKKQSAAKPSQTKTELKKEEEVKNGTKS